MRFAIAQLTTIGVRHRARRRIGRLHESSEGAQGPYSPLFCIGLLLTIVLLANIGQ